ncbi:MAG: N-acetylmuramoyl-L-alanine amidase [Clostridia bacterium]|nr:N-acetylmuramoyl-L-alanine amidase [Clostridia bacterium]
MPTAAPDATRFAETPAPTETAADAPTAEPTPEETPAPEPTPAATPTAVPGSSETVYWDPSWQYAENSKINTGAAVLYHSDADEPKYFTVCVNAGHGTRGGTSVKTLCHPDGTPKVTGGSTAEGSIYATAVSSGTVMLNGKSEAAATLSLAMILKELLLSSGFDVLMIRESSDVQLDNVARTVMANNAADCHVALHYDSSDNDKGLFVCNVAQVASYLEMEPVKSHHLEHEALAACVLAGARSCGIRIYGNGSFQFDLTQTSYSTVPSVNIEVGDRASDISYSGQYAVAKALLKGILNYYNTYVAGNGETDEGSAEAFAGRISRPFGCDIITAAFGPGSPAERALHYKRRNTA